ncbi:hypothetical protein EAF04_000423 [Stromatinia cepivora]|nr:hypothetical protein EAF04_000423 [Stromatinia cepivora]
MSWSELPIEIRFTIWELTFPGPRTIIVTSNEIKSKDKIPVAFHVNYESRKHIGGLMSFLFEGTNLVGSENCQFLYFNSKIDTLFLDDSSDLGKFQFLIGPCWNQRWLDSFIKVPRGFHHLAIQNPESIKECDMVTSLEIRQGINKLDQVCFFKNLEKFTIRYNEYLMACAPRDLRTPIQRALIMRNRLIHDAMVVYGLFQKRLDAGFITKIPEIILSPLFSDAHDIVSSGVSTLKFKFRKARNATLARITMNGHVKDLDCVASYMRERRT